MRKVLISILLIALFALLAGMAITGVTVGNLNLGRSVQAIIDKNYELDDGIIGLNTKIQQEYQTAKANLDASFKKLQSEKQSYQNTIALTSTEDVQAASQTEEYKLNYLWTKIGLYATKNGVVMKADVSHGTSGVSNQYNIAFTAIGDYIGISDFVYEVEKDESLGFRIEEFAMVPYSEQDGEIKLQATFIIKNIAIDPDSLSKSANVESGTVTTNPDGQTGQSGEARSIGGVTVMSDYNNNTNNNANNNTTNNTDSNNTQQ